MRAIAGRHREAALTSLKAFIILDLRMTSAHRKAISQKMSMVPEDWTPFLRSSWIRKVASSWKREKHASRVKGST